MAKARIGVRAVAGGIAESCTFRVMPDVPLLAGVPEIRPVLAFSIKPLGKGPSVVQVYGGVPPAAPRVAL